MFEGCTYVAFPSTEEKDEEDIAERSVVPSLLHYQDFQFIERVILDGGVGPVWKCIFSYFYFLILILILILFLFLFF